jgi:DNA-binding MarR family transcriptional regulator
MVLTATSSTEGPNGAHAREDEARADAVERLLAAGIGITARAIGDAPATSTLTLVQWRVLVIASRSQALRIGELAEHLGISVPSASRLVRRIENRHLVTAVRADDDRRATIVSLTKAGRGLVSDVVARRRDLIRMALRDSDRGRDAEAIALVTEISARLAEYA